MYARIALVFLCCAVAVAQTRSRAGETVRDVSLCELIQHPNSYDGQTVRVRGQVIFEFEAFLLSDSSCSSQLRSLQDRRGVWLTFGGDEPEIATFCCGAHTRTKGADLEVAGHKVGLTRDKEFGHFLQAIKAQRLRRPDGRPCGAECKFYDVTASLTGLFAAAGAHGGYGHLGMFHLLVIQQVSEVADERRPVPFGGTYTCSTDIWSPTGQESLVLRKSLDCTDAADPGCAQHSRFDAVAAHWSDDVKRGSTTQTYIDVDQNRIAEWVSYDLLTSYFMRVSKNRQLTITRENCRTDTPEQNPRSNSLPVACEELNRSTDRRASDEIDRLLQKQDFPAAWAKTADAAKLLLVEGDQSWRRSDVTTAGWHVLRQQAQLWQLQPDSRLQLEKCSDEPIDDQGPIFASCNWYSPDGTQAFYVSLLKERGAAGKANENPWLVTDINAQLCHPESK